MDWPQTTKVQDWPPASAHLQLFVSQPLFIYRCCRWGKADKGFWSKLCWKVFQNGLICCVHILRHCVHCALFVGLSTADFLSPLPCLSQLILLPSFDEVSVMLRLSSLQCVIPHAVSTLFYSTKSVFCNTIEVRIWHLLSRHAFEIVRCFVSPNFTFKTRLDFDLTLILAHFIRV